MNIECEMKCFPLRISLESHKKLRKLAFKKEMSVTQLLRELIENTLKDNKKLLTRNEDKLY